MTAVTTLPFGRALTREDVAALPDDGHRYELLDGALIVTPAPSPRHQRASGRLYRLLDDAAPSDLLVLDAPLQVVLDEATVLQPDFVVAPRTPFTARDLAGAPMLAVEIEGDAYVEVGHAVGEYLLQVDHPFPVRIRPAELVR